MIGALVGAIIIFILGGAMTAWATNSEKFYEKNSNLEPGTYLLFGIIFLFPLVFYGVILFIKGLWTLISVLGKNYMESSSTTKN